MKDPRSTALAALLLALSPALARASTGTCDVDPGDTGPSEMACVAAIQALGPNTVIDDIFTDANGQTGSQLLYGKLVDPFGGCAQANTTCNGDLSASKGFPAVICQDFSHDLATVAPYVAALDWRYANPVRLLDAHGYQGGADALCPTWSQQVADGNKEGYLPWEGMVFDLGGPSNKVALFPLNDHGPQPCESVEYTVYLTDDPLSRDLIDDPSTTGADPTKWNRAKLSQIFLEGWEKVRPGEDPGLTYTIEADSFTSVWSLPCGITFRYVGVIAGNDGKDLPACNFDSYDAEIDAVAGLTEDGAGVCPDADGDKFVACACPTAPAVCDCDDANLLIHPGAPEPCDSPDVDCDGLPGGCAADLVCYQSLCTGKCEGENAFCPAGSSCTQTALGELCVPIDCTQGGCPAGTVCTDDGCVPACTDVVCPGMQICQDGTCIDPCQGVQCPSPEVCQLGVCVPPCACFAGDIGCLELPGTVCDKGSTDLCVPPLCAGSMCTGSQLCDPDTGQCIDFCNAEVVCPAGQHCVDPGGCVPLCEGVQCAPGEACDPMTGLCEDVSCVGVTCILPLVCAGGVCVDGTGGGGGAGSGGAGGQGAGAFVTTGTGLPPAGTRDEGGCGCRTAGGGDARLPISMLLVAAGVAGLSMRRRRR